VIERARVLCFGDELEEARKAADTGTAYTIDDETAIKVTSSWCRPGWG